MKKIKNIALYLTILLFSCSLFSEDQQPPITYDIASLFKAAKEGNAFFIKQAVCSNQNCALQDADGNNLLHIAAIHGHTSIIEELTNPQISWWQLYIYGPTLPNINARNKYGHTPFECCLTHQQNSVLFYFLEKNKGQYLSRHNQLKALMCAAEVDNAFAIQLLEHYNYNLFTQTDEGYNIFHYSIINNKPSIYTHFAKKPEFINTKTVTDIAPIMLAVDANNIPLIDLLVKSGADVNIVGYNKTTPIHLAKSPEMVECLINFKALINAQDNDGYTLLHHHIKNNNTEMVRYLLNKKVDLSRLTKKNETFFKFSINVQANTLIRQMIAQDPSTNLNEQDSEGNTALIDAAKKKDIATIKELLSYNVNTNLCDTLFGENVLHKLAKNGFIAGAEEIIKYNPSLINTSNNKKNSTLFIAVQYNQKDFINLLRQHNASFYMQSDNDKSKKLLTNDKGETVLHLAAHLHDQSLLEQLLPAFSPAEIQQTDNFGLTLLHHAAALGGIKTLKLVHEYGFDYSQTTPTGDNCMHIAAKNNNFTIVQFLKSINNNFETYNNDNETPLIAAAVYDSKETVEFLLTDEKLINGEAEAILMRLQSQCNKIYYFVKEKCDHHKKECNDIVNEYTKIDSLLSQYRSVLALLYQKDPSCTISHTLPSPQHTPLSVIEKMPKHERATLLNHYTQCKNNLTIFINDINQQIERINLAQKKERLEQEKKRAQEEAAQRAAFIEQQRARNQKKSESSHNTSNPVTEAPPMPKPHQSSSVEDRGTYAQSHVDFFNDNLKRPTTSSIHTLSNKEIYEIKQAIKNSVHSNTEIPAHDKETHILQGIQLFVTKKIEEIKNELSSHYSESDLKYAAEKSIKEIMSAIKKLYTIHHEKLAEIIGTEKKTQESNIKKCILKHLKKE